MKSILILWAAICTGASAFSLPHGHPLIHWQAAGPNDVRSPCPLLNTLANHGYLPHDGKNITEEQTTGALKSAINLNEDYAKSLFQAALTTNSDPHATTFSLDDLSRHNILEHDASLSRQDYYLGNDHRFNQAIFDQTRSYWKGPFIDIQQAAAARQARVDTSNATNPTFTLTQASLQLTFGESAAYFVVFGNKTSGIANRAWVEYFFENERFPVEIGWTKPEDEITASDQGNIAQKIADATEKADEQKRNVCRRSDHHGGHAARGHSH